MPADDLQPPVQRSWLQFRTSYLLYVLTVCAVGFTVIRSLVRNHFMRSLTTFELVAVLLMIVYFSVRVPILFRRWRRGVSRTKEHRRQLADLAIKLQDKPKQIDANPDPK